MCMYTLVNKNINGMGTVNATRQLHNTCTHKITHREGTEHCSVILCPPNRSRLGPMWRSPRYNIWWRNSNASLTIVSLSREVIATGGLWHDCMKRRDWVASRCSWGAGTRPTLTGAQVLPLKCELRLHTKYSMQPINQKTLSIKDRTSILSVLHNLQETSWLSCKQSPNVTYIRVIAM